MKMLTVSIVLSLVSLIFAPRLLADEHELDAVDSSRGLIEFFDEKKPTAPNRPGANCVVYADQYWSKSLNNRPRDIRGRRCRGDRIRHMRLRGPVAAGTIIQVFNNGSGSTTRPNDSSWAQIRVNSALGAGQRFIVGSFEPSQSSSALRLQSACNRRSDGGRWCPWGNDDYLDSKISYIRIIPPRAEVDEDLPSIESDADENVYEKPDDTGL
jgi:hypothetical protein